MMGDIFRWMPDNRNDQTMSSPKGENLAEGNVDSLGGLCPYADGNRNL